MFDDKYFLQPKFLLYWEQNRTCLKFDVQSFPSAAALKPRRSSMWLSLSISLSLSLTHINTHTHTTGVFKWRYLLYIQRSIWEPFPLYDNLYIFTTSCLTPILTVLGVIYKAKTGALFGSNFQIIVTHYQPQKSVPVFINFCI
jgi:hypothetical protein